MESLSDYLQFSAAIPGWTRGSEAETLAQIAHGLPEGAVIVEIGAFFGAGTVLLAGARKLCGSGRVHCVDPFDASGDAFSAPNYQAIVAAHGGAPIREQFETTIRRAGLSDWIDIRQGRAEEVAARWAQPIDLLFLDGDQSRAGARAAYTAWIPWLKAGGVIAVHNSGPRDYAVDHDGNYRLALGEIKPPRYAKAFLAGSTTFARKQW
jgi:MMP 1-O-methyltransferase